MRSVIHVYTNVFDLSALLILLIQGAPMTVFLGCMWTLNNKLRSGTIPTLIGFFSHEVHFVHSLIGGDCYHPFLCSLIIISCYSQGHCVVLCAITVYPLPASSSLNDSYTVHYTTNYSGKVENSYT